MFEWVMGIYMCVCVCVCVCVFKMNRDIFDYLTNNEGSPKTKAGTLSMARYVPERKVTPS
jgi:hypothetical protein